MAFKVMLVTGGARSGKSHFAEKRAAEVGGDVVTVVATARPVDDEMEHRIEEHRKRRPTSWATIEAPRGAGAAIAAAKTDVVLLDCLTVLLANTLSDSQPTDEQAALVAMRSETDGMLDAIGAGNGTLLLVTNEVGLGVHPETSLGCWFRDGLGESNRRIAERADEVILMVSGLTVRLK